MNLDHGVGGRKLHRSKSHTKSDSFGDLHGGHVG